MYVLQTGCPNSDFDRLCQIQEMVDKKFDEFANSCEDVFISAKNSIFRLLLEYKDIVDEDDLKEEILKQLEIFALFFKG